MAHYFFIGVAGTGMSAIAQYMKAAGHDVSGSDRQFIRGQFNETQDALMAQGISCYPQGAGGLTADIDYVIVSTAIEDSVPEVQVARQLGKPILRRSELLAQLVSSKKTIAVGGTSGKSTTAAMIYEILRAAGYQPSVIGGAGLTRLIREGKIGNAAYGEGEWLVIEADESDGSIVNYHPEIGLLLNVDKDHQDIEALMQLFGTFANHSRHFITNTSHPLSASLSKGSPYDIHLPDDFMQQGVVVHFSVDDVRFSIQSPGRHTMENAMAAISVARSIGISLQQCADALQQYEGINRRHQILGERNGVVVVDDYAHNPVKCARSIEACQPFSKKLIAWFQPHGYGPTRFLRHDFVEEIAKALRPQDEIWMSEIYYAGGTAVKDISSEDLVNDLNMRGANAFFVANRNQLVDALRPHLEPGTTLLLMGARDPSLDAFAKEVYQAL